MSIDNPSSSSTRKSQIATRLSGILNRIRSNGSSSFLSSSSSNACKKRKSDKERRIQVRWIHYNSLTRKFNQVRTKNGGGNRFILYNDSEPLTFKDIEDKASALFFPSGFSSFAGRVDEMSLSVCDATKTPIFEFPGGGTVASYLQENGLYASNTYLFLRSQDKREDEFERNDRQIYNIDNDDDEDYDDGSLFLHSISNSRRTNIDSMVVCSKCACTYTKGEECIRCQQDKEYHESLVADANKKSEVAVTNNNIESVEDGPLTVEEDSVQEEHLTVEEMRQRRLAALAVFSSADTTGMLVDNNLPDIPDLDNIAGMFDDNGPGVISDGSPPLLKTKHLRVHRSCLKKDLISHFKDESILKHEITYEVIYQRGEMEKDVHDNMFYLDAFKRYLSPSEEEMINEILENGDILEERDELDDFIERKVCMASTTAFSVPSSDLILSAREEDKSLEVEEVSRSTDQDDEQLEEAAGNENGGKTVIRRGKIAGESETWNLAEAGASITFSLGTIANSLAVTCSLWSSEAISLPIGKDEILVSNVIELSHDGPPDLEFMETAPGRINVGLSHGASNLNGYEVVVKQLVDPEYNEWKDLETTTIWHMSVNPTVPNWMFPFAEATCTKTWFSSYAVVWRLKSFVFPKLTSVTPELICSVPDYPNVSVTIPRNSLPTDTDFCLTLKVQETPRINHDVEEMFVGPILHISCSRNVKLSEFVKISVPLALNDGEREPVELQSGHLRILHFKSSENSQEWTDITDHLEMPVVLRDGIATFQVKAFCRFWPWLLKTSSVPWQYVSCFHDRVMKQRAGFLVSLCDDALPSRKLLIFSCFPQHLRFKESYDISSTHTVSMQGYVTSPIPLSYEEETFVSLSDGFEVREEGRTEDIVLR
ncbi:hypothetical protein AWC38_SpisGene20812 [Stylophora pistillata]|uniref:ZU5 domain-containing protein n=1 Tax=Stylophora pistillata TaxID=50429 RepID=A0A2B4R9H1_STYPI|nr:hypothetical protein AWC38_SpisGene20812 [Stylophora pistillata]